MRRARLVVAAAELRTPAPNGCFSSSGAITVRQHPITLLTTKTRRAVSKGPGTSQIVLDGRAVVPYEAEWLYN
jgi:hypothetical protein